MSKQIHLCTMEVISLYLLCTFHYLDGKKKTIPFWDTLEFGSWRKKIKGVASLKMHSCNLEIFASEFYVVTFPLIEQRFVCERSSPIRLCRRLGRFLPEK